ncbi:hypothetical protein IWQ51_002300 [Labrenzia sp. EL_142]|nr:hypothetical protein [Labrenzia sp. EL_142]
MCVSLLSGLFRGDACVRAADCVRWICARISDIRSFGAWRGKQTFKKVETNDLNAGNPHIGINSVTAAIRLCPGTVAFYTALLADGS